MRTILVLTICLSVAAGTAAGDEASDAVAEIESALQKGILHFSTAWKTFTEHEEAICRDLNACLRVGELFGRVDLPFENMRAFVAETIRRCAVAAVKVVERDDIPGRIRVVRLLLLAAARKARDKPDDDWVGSLREDAGAQAKLLGKRAEFERIALPLRAEALLGIIELVGMLEREGLEKEAGELRERALERQVELQAATAKGGDPALRARGAATAIDCGQLQLRSGEVEAARQLAARAEENLRSQAETEGATAEAHLQLARALAFRARLDPENAEALLQRASASCERAREAGGESGEFYLRVGQTSLLSANLLQARLAKTPRDKELAKAADAALKQAFDAFKKGLKADEENLALRSAYNECLWQMMRRGKGRARGKPVMEEHLASCDGVKFSLPVSEAWKVEFPFCFDGCVFEALKHEREAGDVLVIRIYRYEWDTNYRDAAGKVIGGENISGLAERHEDEIREAFEEIRERIPLRKLRLSKEVKKAQGFAVKGLTKRKGAYEWRSIFFKHAKAEATYEIIVFASLGLLDRNPWELDSILGSFETVLPR